MCESDTLKVLELAMSSLISSGGIAHHMFNFTHEGLREIFNDAYNNVEIMEYCYLPRIMQRNGMLSADECLNLIDSNLKNK